MFYANSTAFHRCFHPCVRFCISAFFITDYGAESTGNNHLWFSFSHGRGRVPDGRWSGWKHPPFDQYGPCWSSIPSLIFLDALQSAATFDAYLFRACWKSPDFSLNSENARIISGFYPLPTLYSNFGCKSECAIVHSTSDTYPQNGHFRSGTPWLWGNCWLQ